MDRVDIITNMTNNEITKYPYQQDPNWDKNLLKFWRTVAELDFLNA